MTYFKISIYKFLKKYFLWKSQHYHQVISEIAHKFIKSVYKQYPNLLSKIIFAAIQIKKSKNDWKCHYCFLLFPLANIFLFWLENFSFDLKIFLLSWEFLFWVENFIIFGWDGFFFGIRIFLLGWDFFFWVKKFSFSDRARIFFL